MNTSETPYIHIWNKYRPVILRLMVDACGTAQHYEFSSHEFTRVFPKNRAGLRFILYFHRSSALNNIKTSLLAKDLLGILRESHTAVKLGENSTYEFILDGNFVLHVRKNTSVEIAAAVISSDARQLLDTSIPNNI
jgi:hypothetical protein